MGGNTILLHDSPRVDLGEAAEARPPGLSPALSGHLEAITPPTSVVPSDRRRDAMAMGILEILRHALGDPDTVDLVLDRRSPDRTVPADRPPRTRLVIHGPDAIARLLLPPTGDSFAEAYLRGDLDIEGDVMTALLAARTLDPRRLAPSDVRRMIRWTLALRDGAVPATPLGRVSRMSGPRHSKARDMAAIRFHYDVGETFYSLWLDPRMAYSCAYFPDGATAATAADLLDAAQEAKLDLIAHKLRLDAKTRLLDIGSGWGSLINFAAERYGSSATGVTLSERQADESNRRANLAGLGSRATAEVRDYRDLADLGAFDAVASVGMFEHVGRANLPTYFHAAFDALAPGGLFLNHGIAASGPSAGLGRRLRPGAAHFLQRYVFPDGELVTVEEAVAVARRSGFEVLDVQSLRPHYALTLAAWVARLEANWDQAVETAGEEVARTWRLYMSAARLGFERGELDVCQLLLAKPAGARPAGTPLRPWW